MGNILGYSVAINSADPAWLRFNLIETNGATNLNLTVGTLTMWAAPKWSSATTNQNGTGPGVWGRLLDVGGFSTNASGWWSIYIDSTGENIYFSAQTNSGNGAFTNYLSAPIDWGTNEWHFIALTYSATNTALYLDGELSATGSVVSVYPGPEVTTNGFWIGTESNGFAQIHGLIDDVYAYDSALDATNIAHMYGNFRGIYGINPYNAVASLHSATSSPTYYDTYFNAVTGNGNLTCIATNGAGCITSSDVWITNVTAWATGGTMSVQFSIAGGSNNFAYDVFANSVMTFSTDPELAWSWMGQGYHCSTYLLTNLPLSSCFLILGGPTDSDIDGLTDAYERLVSKTDPFSPDTDGDGLIDGCEFLQGTDLLNPDTGNTGLSDGYKDPDGDGWNNMQEFQNGTNPNSFNTPPAPQGLTVFFHPDTRMVDVNWQFSRGSVTNYTLQRVIPQLGTTTNINVSGGTDNFEDLFPAFEQSFDYIRPTYRLQAHYVGGDSAWSAPVTLYNSAGLLDAALVRGPQGSNYLVVSALPADTVSMKLTRQENYPSSSTTNFTFAVTNLVNGVYLLPGNWTKPLELIPGSSDYYYSLVWYLQAVKNSGELSSPKNPGGSFAIPFFDGRTQLIQNLRFQLRATPTYEPLKYSFQGQYGPTLYSITNSTDYVHSGLYASIDSNPDSDTYFDEFSPFELNYRYRNFVFDPSELYLNGWPTTGADWGNVYPFYNDAATLFYPPTHAFALPTNLVMISPLIDSSQSRWLFEMGFSPNIASSSAEEMGITNDYSDLVMGNSARNWFGLPYLSAKIAWGSGAGDNVTLNAGGSVPYNGGVLYVETAQPGLQQVNYFFGRLGIEPLPGQKGFSTTNATPLLITSVGKTDFRLAGYAKLAVTNGYAGGYGYLGQYFDKALKTTNGVVTTNETGILSPYGEFFPTEPGRVELVTMPDIDTGQRGTCTVYVAKMELDVNHDGTIDRTFAGPDNTSSARPFRFWVNNNFQTYGEDSPTGVPDFADGIIKSARDLEDFSRLWISGLPALPASNGYSASLSWRNVQNAPQIKIYPSVESDGGIAYLTNGLTANDQLSVIIGQIGPGQALGEVAPNNIFQFPADYFAQTGRKHFLFEGSGVGKGELVLTISQGTNTVAETSAWIDLHDVKDFYEQVIITNNSSGARSNWTSGVHRVQPATSTALGDEEELLVFVHGINVPELDWLLENDAVFKRLYWAGFEGKFASVRWPCDYLTPPKPFKFDVFNLSELHAYKASHAFTNYLNQLLARFPNYRRHFLAHSQGNAVVSEAMSRTGWPFDTYILTQAALPDSSYDVNAPTNAAMAAYETGSGVTPDWQPMGYHGVYTNLTGRIVNFYNPLDKALGYWVDNQKQLKPSYPYVSNGTTSTNWAQNYAVTDSQESRAMVARSRTLSVGQSGPTTSRGVIQSAFDLNAQFGFTGASFDEHSAQWTRPIQTSRAYYQQVLTSCQIQPAP